MKGVLFFAAIICFAFPSCNKTPLNPAPASLDGKWRMIIVRDNSSGTTITKPSSIQGEVEITFTSTNSTAGTFTGNTPTNDIWQNDYSLGTNGSINIPALAMTKVGETSWGKEFVDNIVSSQAYSFEVDGKLNIKTTNKTLTFKKL